MKRACVLFSAALAACSLGASADEKAEAGRISYAVDALRAAPNAQKPQLFGALKTATCALPDLCEFKRVCVSGYELHLRGLAETARAKALLASGAPPGEITSALAGASEELKKAEPLIGACDDAQGTAHRTYKF